MHRTPGRRFRLALSLAVLATPAFAHAQSGAGTGGKLVLTGGVSQVEGAGGGGLVPWALIGGQGAAGQVGAQAYYTHVALDDYTLDSFGALVGISDRLEVSLARQRFDTRNVGTALGLGRGFTIQQDVVGVKLRLAGDAIVEQDAWLPQIAVGFQYKRNDQPGLLAAIGARDHADFEPYLSATKLYLAQSLLVNGTLRYTRANQFGILGFGGDLRGSRRLQFEGSAALLLRRNLAVGVEYRAKPNNLGIAREDDAFDAFIAWAPSKHLSLTLAYVDLGNIVIADDQRGLYASLQVGF
ncbi:MAG: DUF3034 family protein [Xanthomonadales bacterium]|nr:DUF3034 family protein [Xanthomonadales bacterium]